MSDDLTPRELSAINRLLKSALFDFKFCQEDDLRTLTKWINGPHEQVAYHHIALLPYMIINQLAEYLLPRQLQIIQRIAALNSLGIRFGVIGKFKIDHILFQAAHSRMDTTWYNLSASMQHFYLTYPKTDSILRMSIQHFLQNPFNPKFSSWLVHAKPFVIYCGPDEPYHCMAWGFCDDLFLIADRSLLTPGIRIFHIPQHIERIRKFILDQSPETIIELAKLQDFLNLLSPNRVLDSPKDYQWGINCTQIAFRHELYLLLFSYAYYHYKDNEAHISERITKANDYAQKTAKRLNHFDRQYALKQYLANIKVPGSAERSVLAQILLKSQRHTTGHEFSDLIHQQHLVQNGDLQEARLQMLQLRYAQYLQQEVTPQKLSQTMGPILQAYLKGMPKETFFQYERQALAKLNQPKANL